MILNRMYSNEYMFRQSNEIEDTLGPILYRREESIDDVHNFKSILKTYNILDIHKIFNMSLTEYLNLTTYARNIINETANEIQEEMAKEMEEVGKELKDIKSSIGGYDTGVLDG